MARKYASASFTLEGPRGAVPWRQPRLRNVRQPLEERAGGFIEANLWLHSNTAATAFRGALPHCFREPTVPAARSRPVRCRTEFLERLDGAYFAARPRASHCRLQQAVLGVIASQCSSTMNLTRTWVDPSSPDSARKITSRSSGTLSRFNISSPSAMRVTFVPCPSTAPRP